jgi:UrcA family protein
MNPTASAKTLLATSILTLGLGFVGLCAAEEPQVTVTYRDLAVTTPQGARVLYKRIRFAADEVCSNFDHGDLASKAHKNACMDKAIADAVMHVGEPQLISLYNSKHSAPLPASPASSTIASR